VTQRNQHKYGVSKKEDRIADGILFGSKLEKNGYVLFRDSIGLDRIILQPRFELQPKFKFQGKGIRAIHYIADFLIDYHYVIDTKGILTPEFRIKEKIFMRKFHRPIVILKSQKAIREFIQDLRSSLRLDPSAQQFRSVFVSQS
jgi:hypothetical protein